MFNVALGNVAKKTNAYPHVKTSSALRIRTVIRQQVIVSIPVIEFHVQMDLNVTPLAVSVMMCATVCRVQMAGCVIKDAVFLMIHVPR